MDDSIAASSPSEPSASEPGGSGPEPEDLEAVFRFVGWFLRQMISLGCAGGLGLVVYGCVKVWWVPEVGGVLGQIIPLGAAAATYRLGLLVDDAIQKIARPRIAGLGAAANQEARKKLKAAKSRATRTLQEAKAQKREMLQEAEEEIANQRALLALLGSQTKALGAGSRTTEQGEGQEDDAREEPSLESEIEQLKLELQRHRDAERERTPELKVAGEGDVVFRAKTEANLERAKIPSE